MPWGWVAAATVVSGAVQADSAGRAGRAQERAADAGVAEQGRQFDEMVRLMSPYVEAASGGEEGGGSLQAMLDLIGLGGEEAQAGAISALERSPQFAALLQQGEEGILANASATGGLRGGNTQDALMRFRPAALSALINDQYGRLAGITQLGQASAAGQASGGIQIGNNITQLLGQIGSAQAGAALGQGQAAANTASSLSSLALLKQMKVF